MGDALAGSESEAPRLAALRAMVADDPHDDLARLLLGNECLALGLCEEAAGHLSSYVASFDGDKGAACLSLARARSSLGDRVGAMEAIDLGIENARAHRHLQLAASLEAERALVEGS